MFELILILIILAHIILSIIGTVMISRSTVLDQKKGLNILLLWLVPFLWFVLIKYLIKPTPGSNEVPIKNDVSSNVFHESGKGAPYTDIKS